MIASQIQRQRHQISTGKETSKEVTCGEAAWLFQSHEGGSGFLWKCLLVIVKNKSCDEPGLSPNLTSFLCVTTQHVQSPVSYVLRNVDPSEFAGTKSTLSFKLLSNA